MAVLLPSIAFSKDQVSGTWSGESTCEQREPTCRDESVVYHFDPLPDKPGTFSVHTEKIIDGRAANMGSLEFRYIEDSHALICDYAQGTWRLTVDRDTMTGSLTRADKTLFRRVTLRKQQ